MSIQVPENWRAFWPLPLRVVVGGALFVAGFIKLFSSVGRQNIVHELAALSVPAPEIMGWVVGGAELLCGLALLLGALTAIASIIMLANLGGLILLSAVGRIGYPETLALPGLGFPYRLPSYEAAAVIIACLIALLLGGPGRLSLDGGVARRRAV